MKAAFRAVLACAATYLLFRWMRVPALLLLIVAYFALRRREWWQPNERQ